MSVATQGGKVVPRQAVPGHALCGMHEPGMAIELPISCY